MQIVSKDREDAANHLEFRWIRDAAIRTRSDRRGKPYWWWGLCVVGSCSTGWSR